MQEEKVNVNRDGNSKNKEMLQIKNIVIEKKQPLMNSLLDWQSWKNHLWAWDMSEETSKMVKQKGKKDWKKIEYLRTVGQL